MTFEPRSFRIASQLATATAVLMFGLIVIGSVVRTTGSGLACPDWPLCHGQLIPPMQFNVLIEWFHRLVALLVSLLLFATVGWIAVRPELRARLGGIALLAVLLLVTQILLGALTVWKLLSPSVVSGHLAVALLLFGSMLILALAAGAESEPEPAGVAERRPPGLLPLFAIATAMVYGQSLLGGIVSTHHASLVCPDWPACNGQLFPPLEGLVGLQMLHRYGAYALVVAMLLVAWRARSAPDGGIRAGGSMVLGLTLAQVVFGVCNIFLGAPVWLSAMHLATAAAILALMVSLTFRASLLPAVESRRAMVTAS